MDKKKFENLRITIIRLDEKDVCTASDSRFDDDVADFAFVFKE